MIGEVNERLYIPRNAPSTDDDVLLCHLRKQVHHAQDLRQDQVSTFQSFFALPNVQVSEGKELLLCSLNRIRQAHYQFVRERAVASSRLHGEEAILNSDW